METQAKGKELGIEIEGHYDEIEGLNNKYVATLKDKVNVYIELV